MAGKRRISSILAMLVLLPSLALGYGIAMHNLLPRHALAGIRPRPGSPGLDDSLPPLSDADLALFRRQLYDRAAHLSDTALRAAFLRRYATPDAFGAAAFKEFLMMNGAAPVMGVDSFASVYRAMSPSDRRQDPHPDFVSGRRLVLGSALELGSIYPDLDRRNQNRLLRDAAGAPRRGSAGDSIPFDPATLNMGRASGLSSQASAHYGLNRQPKSEDPAVLKSEPWNFALATTFKGPVLTTAPDNAQQYTDLALIAALDGRPAFRTLGALYAGNAMHYIGDVGNAVHTIQVGIYPIFVDATIQAWLSRFRHLFGLLGRPRTRNEIGLDIISNLHLLSEKLFQVEVVSALRGDTTVNSRVHPDVAPALRSLQQGDDSLARAVHDTLSLLSGQPVADFGRVIADVVIDANYRDGAAVYRVTRDLADKPLRKGSIRVDFDTIPDDQVWRFVQTRHDAPGSEELAAFNAVHARGLARTSTALRAWWEELSRVTETKGAARDAAMNAVVTRLVRERLEYLRQAEQRRAEWMAEHGER